MDLDRARTDAKIVSNRLVRQAAGEAVQDLTLPVGQSGYLCIRPPLSLTLPVPVGHLGKADVQGLEEPVTIERLL